MPPANIKFPTNAELWVSAIPLPADQPPRIRSLTVFARRKYGVTAAQAQAELDGIVKRLAAAHPASNKELTVGVVQTFNERFNAGPVRIVFLTLMARVGFVLLIACATWRLLLSRSTARAREVAVRYAMGGRAGASCDSRRSKPAASRRRRRHRPGHRILIGTRLFIAPSPRSASLVLDRVHHRRRGHRRSGGDCVGTSPIFGLVPALQVARTRSARSSSRAAAAAPAPGCPAFLVGAESSSSRPHRCRAARRRRPHGPGASWRSRP